MWWWSESIEIIWSYSSVFFWQNVTCCAQFIGVSALGDLEVGFVSITFHPFLWLVQYALATETSSSNELAISDPYICPCYTSVQDDEEDGSITNPGFFLFDILFSYPSWLSVSLNTYFRFLEYLVIFFPRYGFTFGAYLLIFFVHII